jgi:hypothetical protein
MADSKGTWSATGTSSLLVPANYYRAKLVIQMTSSDSCWIAFNEAAVSTEGYAMIGAGGTVILNGPEAQCAIYGICANGKTATGGYQENIGISN